MAKPLAQQRQGRVGLLAATDHFAEQTARIIPRQNAALSHPPPPIGPHCRMDILHVLYRVATALQHLARRPASASLLPKQQSDNASAMSIGAGPVTLGPGYFNTARQRSTAFSKAGILPRATPTDNSRSPSCTVICGVFRNSSSAGA